MCMHKAHKFIQLSLGRNLCMQPINFPADVSDFKVWLSSEWFSSSGFTCHIVYCCRRCCLARFILALCHFLKRKYLVGYLRIWRLQFLLNTITSLYITLENYCGMKSARMVATMNNWSQEKKHEDDEVVQWIKLHVRNLPQIYHRKMWHCPSYSIPERWLNWIEIVLKFVIKS